MTARPRPTRSIAAVVAATAALLLAGCGGSTPVVSGSSPNAGNPTTSGGSATSKSSAASSSSATSSPPAATGASGAPESNNPSGDIPDSQVFVPFTPTSGLFTVSVPEGWARSDTGTGTVFTDKLNSVTIDTVARPQPPDPASATATELPAIGQAATNFQPGDVTTVTRKAGDAVLITYTADSAPDPVTGKSTTDAVERYEFWKNGTEVILTLSGPTGADNVDPWRTITDSFGWAG